MKIQIFNVYVISVRNLNSKRNIFFKKKLLKQNTKNRQYVGDADEENGQEKYFKDQNILKDDEDDGNIFLDCGDKDKVDQAR